MAQYARGEPIPLNFGGGRPDYHVVYGHVEDAVAIAAAIDDLAEADCDPPELGFVVRHQWARWVWVSDHPDSDELGGTLDGRCRVLRLHWDNTVGRGLMKVTVAYDADDWEAQAEYRRRQRGLETMAREAVEARWPGSTVTWVRGAGDTGQTVVHFIPPGFTRDVSWTMGSDSVWMPQCDVEAWEKYLAEVSRGTA